GCPCTDAACVENVDVSRDRDAGLGFGLRATPEVDYVAGGEADSGTDGDSAIAAAFDRDHPRDLVAVALVDADVAALHRVTHDAGTVLDHDRERPIGGAG